MICFLAVVFFLSGLKIVRPNYPIIYFQYACFYLRTGWHMLKMYIRGGNSTVELPREANLPILSKWFSQTQKVFSIQYTYMKFLT